jgi:zinc/manganese transport system substrate-binding protein
MRRSPVWVGLVGTAMAVTVMGCSSSDDTATRSTDTSTGGCPGQPVDVVVTVDQWTDAVEQLGGACVEVTTIITGADVDPHDFEPSPRDSAAFSDADLVVMNGAGYDHWADDALATLDSEPAVVDAGEVVGREEGDNPHLWYDPEAVQQVSAAVATELKLLVPDAAQYLDEQVTTWADALRPYLDEVASLHETAEGRTYAATESVFDDTATTLGLVDATPAGYRTAAANESDPAPADINAFQRLLQSGDVDVLIVNVQTEGAIPAQLRAVAEQAKVPVVEVTETQPSEAGSFVAWQVDQLRTLAQALGG